VAATPRFKVGHLLISARIPRTTETVAKHEGKEADSLIRRERPHHVGDFVRSGRAAAGDDGEPAQLTGPFKL
jgi:hypothetical protein